MATIEEAVQLMEMGQVDEAVDIVKEKLKQATDDEKYSIAELYYEWGYFEEAIVVLEEMLQKFPKEGQLITKLAEMYIELEKDDLAIDLLNEIDSADSFYGSALLHLADLYQAQGLFEVSEQKLLEAKKLYPDEIIIDFALGELLFSIGQSNRALPFYEKVVKQEKEINNISIVERLAECHATIGHYEEAIEYYGKLNSKNPDTLFKYGMTAYQQNRNEIAIQVWKELVELDPYYHTVYFELANALKEEGFIQEAYDTVQKGLSYDEFDKTLFLLAGQLAIQLDKQKESIEYLMNAISLDYDYKEAILTLITLYKENDQQENIIQLIQEIQRSGATDPIYTWELARAYNEEEQYKEALQAYKEASTDLMHDTEFLKEYGFYLTEEGLQKEALEIFLAYREIEPMDEDVNSFIERLNFSNND